MRIWCVHASWGSYDTSDHDVIAVYSTKELADTHADSATAWIEENIRPLAKQLSRRWDSEIAGKIDVLSMSNPWHPSSSCADDCHYSVYEDEVLSELPKGE